MQLHYVGAAYDPTNAEAERKGAVSKGALLGLRKRSQRLNPKLASDSGTLADLSWQNFIKEVFLDSETAIGLISTPPGPVSPGGGGAAEGDDAHPRRDQPHHAVAPHARAWPGDAAARPGRSRLHGAAGGNAEGRRLEGVYRRRVPRASSTAGSSTTRRSPTRCSRKRAQLGVRRFCVHKGLPLGPVADYNHPRDLIKAAKDFPDIDFFAYHSGLLGVTAPKPTGEVPWTTEFCEMKKKEPGIKNIYMELGSTFGQLVTTNPTACAHLLGQMIEAFGADHVLWGTDSIWYGTPQWQIEAFRRFQIPDALVEKHGYAPLTRSVKEQIFGLNAARVFDVDVSAKRNEIPADYLSQIKMAYLEEGRARRATASTAGLRDGRWAWSSDALLKPRRISMPRCALERVEVDAGFPVVRVELDRAQIRNACFIEATSLLVAVA